MALTYTVVLGYQPNLLDYIKAKIMFPMVKHNLAKDPEEEAVNVINRMTNYELLQEISFALQDMKDPNRFD